MKLVKAQLKDFDFIYAEMEKNFISDERRDKEDARKLLDNDSYIIYIAQNGKESIGFVTVWELSEFAFVEHFVTYEAYRNKGYGSRVLSCLKQKYNALILEAEPPKSDIQKRRISFYERNGFLQNPQKYIQPAYRKGGNGVELVLMSFPSTTCDFSKTVSEIYNNVYGTEESYERKTFEYGI